MNNKNKYILVYYINVSGVRSVDIPEIMNELSKKISINDLDAESIFIPIQHGESRVECINPKYITKEELINEHSKLMFELNENLSDQLKILKENKNG